MNKGIHATRTTCATHSSNPFTLCSPPTHTPPSPKSPSVSRFAKSFARLHPPSVATITTMARNVNTSASPVLSSTAHPHASGLRNAGLPVRFGETTWGSYPLAATSSQATRVPRSLAITTPPAATHYTDAQLLGRTPAWTGAYQVAVPQPWDVQQTKPQRTYQHE